MPELLLRPSGVSRQCAGGTARALSARCSGALRAHAVTPALSSAGRLDEGSRFLVPPLPRPVLSVKYPVALHGLLLGRHCSPHLNLLWGTPGPSAGHPLGEMGAHGRPHQCLPGSALFLLSTLSGLLVWTLWTAAYQKMCLTLCGTRQGPTPKSGQFQVG